MSRILYRVVSLMEFGEKIWAYSFDKEKCEEFLREFNKLNPPVEYDREVRASEAAFLE